MYLFGGGSVINWATPFSSYIRVDFDGRCGEASEALPACKTGLSPAFSHMPATAPAPDHVPYTIKCFVLFLTKEKPCPEEVLEIQLPPPPIFQVEDFLNLFLLLLLIHLFKSFTDYDSIFGPMSCHVLSMSMKNMKY